MAKKNIWISAVILIIVSLSGSFWYFYHSLKIKKVPLAEMENKSKLGLILVKRESPTSTDTIIYRLNDAKEEIFSGNWKMNYNGPKEILLFGSKPDYPEQQYFITLNSEKGDIKEISKLPGKILDAAPSPSGEYLLLNGIKNNTDEKKSNNRYLCLTALHIHSYEKCKMIPGGITNTTSTAVNTFWNKDKDSELVMQEINGEGRIWTYDADERTLKRLDTKLDPIPSAQAIINEALKNEYQIQRFANLAVVKTSKEQYFFRVPSDAKLIPVEKNFILAVEGDKVSLVDMKKRKISDFIQLAPGGQGKIFTYYHQ